MSKSNRDCPHGLSVAVPEADTQVAGDCGQRAAMDESRSAESLGDSNERDRPNPHGPGVTGRFIPKPPRYDEVYEEGMKWLNGL